jgi:hypothetical protein
MNVGVQDSNQPMKWTWTGLPTAGNVDTTKSPLANHLAVTQLDPVIARELPESVRLPLVRDPVISGRLLCYTWFYGRKPWMPTFFPPMKSWAIRHGIDLKVWQQAPDEKQFKQSPLVNWLRIFLDAGHDWFMYLDADVMIHPQAPHPLSEVHPLGVLALAEPEQKKHRSEWASWVKAHFQREVTSDFIYRNDGVWMMDRATAVKFLSYCEQHMLPGNNDAYYFNLWLHDAQQADKIEVHDLPQKWNRLPYRAPYVANVPAWFYHCSGANKGKALEHLQLDGFLPQAKAPVTVKPWPAEANQERLIAMPYHFESDPWKGESLRYSLRSLDQYWPEDWPLMVFGTHQLEWLIDSVYQNEPSYPQALLRSCSMAKKVLWMNDDIILLESCNEVDMMIPLCHDDLIPTLPKLLRSENRWARARAHVTGRMHHDYGLDRLNDFSTHTPYLYERDHARKVFDLFGVWHKFPIELAYHGLLGSTGKPCVEKATWAEKDDPAMRYLYVDDGCATLEEFTAWMSKRFPRPSRWEKTLPV